MAWSSLIQGLRSVKTTLYYAWVGVLLFVFSNNAYAAADIQTILTNLQNIIYPFTDVALFISFVVGMFMVLHAVLTFKKMGVNMSTHQQSQQGEILGPIVHLIIGGALMYLPTTNQMFMGSIFGSSTSIFSGNRIDYTQLGQGQQLLGYVSGGNFEQQWAQFANTLVLYIQFIGLLAFIKGLMMLAKGGQHGAQPGTVAKGFTHMLGGAIAMNFVTFINILYNTVLGS